MLNCQKDLFDFEEGVTYLNGAYMSPMLNSVRDAGLLSLARKSRPWTLPPTSFFDGVEKLKKLVSTLIHSKEYDRIAIIPSVSYGMANVAQNIDFKPGDHIVLLDKQFPSNYFVWKRIADRVGVILDIVSPPVGVAHRGKAWNEAVLNAITPLTKLVAIEQVHWVDGTLFDLKSIREKSRSLGALMVVDLTQSLGAYPFDQTMYDVDAIIAAGYKFLMGPYAMGIAYYGKIFDHGVPIEENWMNKRGSEVFEKLLDYETEYKSGAARYSMGEQSQFIHVPMQIAAVEQILNWGASNVQAYCEELVNSILPVLSQHGIWIEEKNFRASHLFGIRPPAGISVAMKEKLLANKIYVSYRGDTIRISPNVYNTKQDLQRLIAHLV